MRSLKATTGAMILTTLFIACRPVLAGAQEPAETAIVEAATKVVPTRGEPDDRADEGCRRPPVDDQVEPAANPDDEGRNDCHGGRGHQAPPTALASASDGAPATMTIG